MRKCELLLPEIERNRVWEDEGFNGIFEYAAKLAGMSREKVRDSLRILKKIEDKPELMKVAREKGLRAVRPVCAIAKKEDDKFWAEKADSMSDNTFRIYVKEYKKEELTYSGNDQKLWDIPKLELKTIMMQVEQEKPKTAVTDSRHMPTKISQYARAKTNGSRMFQKSGRPSPYRPICTLKRTQPRQDQTTLQSASRSSAQGIDPKRRPITAILENSKNTGQNRHQIHDRSESY